VDPIALGIPNYFEIISTPMDITTVENKVKDFIYNNDEEFNEDIRLIWRNAK
jgi:bromodomain-containing factor 1